MVWILVAVLAVPGYDRRMADHSDRRAAESELVERREHRSFVRRLLSA